MPRSYPDEFRVRAVSLIRSDQTVKKTASDLDVSCAILHCWDKQELIDRVESLAFPLPSPRRRVRRENVLVSWRRKLRFFAEPMK